MKQTRGGRHQAQPQLFGVEQMRQDFRSAVDDGVESTVHQHLGSSGTAAGTAAGTVAVAVAVATLHFSSGGGGFTFDFGGALGQMNPSPQDLAQRTKDTWGKTSVLVKRCGQVWASVGKCGQVWASVVTCVDKC